MEPMMPPEGNKILEDLAFDLSTKAHALEKSVNPFFKNSMAHLVRTMNCYYSNLIEGHNTHPRDIDRALNEDYETQPEKRNLQLEARAHMEVQRLIHELPEGNSCVSEEFILWIHREFCSRLPNELLFVENPLTGVFLRINPGEWRNSGVQVGRHIPPKAEDLHRFMARFSEVYDPSRHSKMRQIIAAAASHHRLLWIHPFYDGNGRVARLFSDTFMKSIGVGNDLWSVSRGLARTVQSYKNGLAEADMPRRNDLDGRGTLSQDGLVAFCTYFLKTAIDQVDFMGNLLDIKGFLSRLEKVCESYAAKGHISPGSFPLLREVFYNGEIERGHATSLTGYKERQARTVLSKLIKEEFVISDSPKGRIKLNFPARIIEDLFPNLYPE